MVGNAKEIPTKFVFTFAFFAMASLIVGILISSVFLSGKAFGIPNDFAVDNEERIYLSYNSGVYVVMDGKFYAIWPPNRDGGALSVSEDDMLTIANGAEIRVADLTRSDLKAGRLELVKSVFAPNNVLYSIGMEQHETDPQNGITYRYKGNFFYYEIYREANGTSTLFFSMPRNDYIWNLAARICVIMWSIFVVAGVLLMIAYLKKHPEYSQEARNFWKKRSN